MKNYNELGNNEVAFFIKTKDIQDSQLEKQLGKELLVFLKSIMTQKEAYHYLVISDEDEVFLFLNKSKTNQIIDFLKSKNILDSYREISMDILMNRVRSDNFKKTFAKEDRFTMILDKFISENLTVDLVLDKINERGIDSLKKIDYDILKSNKYG